MIRSPWNEHNEQDSNCPISQSVSIARNHRQRIEENSQITILLSMANRMSHHCRIQNKRQNMVISRHVHTVVERTAGNSLVQNLLNAASSGSSLNTNRYHRLHRRPTH